MLANELNNSSCLDISFFVLQRDCGHVVDLCHTHHWHMIIRIRNTKPMKTNELRITRECLVNNSAFGSGLAWESFQLPKTYQEFQVFFFCAKHSMQLTVATSTDIVPICLLTTKCTSNFWSVILLRDDCANPLNNTSIV